MFAYQNLIVPSASLTLPGLCAGLNGLLKAVIAANEAGISAPAAAPVVNPSGGGTALGLLAPGTYMCVLTALNGVGETTASPESLPFTVAAGDIPQITFPAPSPGLSGYSVYLTPPGGASGSEVLYYRAAGFFGGFNLAEAAPVAPYAVPPPTVNSTPWPPEMLAMLRCGEHARFQRLYDRVRALLRAYAAGNPVPQPQMIADLSVSLAAMNTLTTVMYSAAQLVDANPGHLTTVPTGIGGMVTVRVWP